MTDFIRQIDSPTLDDFAAAINDEEAGGSAFVKSTIALFESRLTNLALFHDLAPGTLPAGEVQVLDFAAPAPANATLVWSGAVVIAATNVAVSVFR